MRQHRPFSRATWCIYLLLLAFRVYIALSPGYIHPDEFFQSPEITAGDIFNFEANIPWEYDPKLPCRSILIPALTTGIPFLLLKVWLGNGPDTYVTSRALFLTQRLAFILVTILIDWAVVKLARQIRRSPSIALMLVSSSYVTISYHTHPFSNTSETAILALSAVTLGGIIKKCELSVPSGTQPPNSTKAQGNATTTTTTTTTESSINSSRLNANPKTSQALPALLLGVLFSLGAFTRITFVLYGFPLGVMFMWINFKVARSRPTFASMIAQFTLACIPPALGIGLASAFAILADSFYFGKITLYNQKFGSDISISQLLLTHPHDWTHITIKGSPTITMLNNLQYNLDVNNLAEHGLHPRFFHLLLNFPVLYGNLAIFSVIVLFQKLKAKHLRSDSDLVTALAYSGLCGLFFLSSMPHQEARFLTPLILPLVVSLSGRISKLGHTFWPLWLLFNAVLAIIFGIFHQSGIVPAIEKIQHQSFAFQDCALATTTQNDTFCVANIGERGSLHTYNGINYTTHVIFYKTYMPPHHLFGYKPQLAQSHGISLTISDWRTKSRTELIEGIQKGVDGDQIVRADRDLLKSVRHQNHLQSVVFRKTGPNHFERTILVAPATVDFTDQDFYESNDSIFKHTNFDHMDIILKNPLTSLYLNLYYL